jgi:hypothetical protein
MSSKHALKPFASLCTQLFNVFTTWHNTISCPETITFVHVTLITEVQEINESLRFRKGTPHEETTIVFMDINCTAT